jgi:hypothetical protein
VCLSAQDYRPWIGSLLACSIRCCKECKAAKTAMGCNNYKECVNIKAFELCQGHERAGGCAPAAWQACASLPTFLSKLLAF